MANITHNSLSNLFDEIEENIMKLDGVNYIELIKKNYNTSFLEIGIDKKSSTLKEKIKKTIDDSPLKPETIEIIKNDLHSKTFSSEQVSIIDNIKSLINLNFIKSTGLEKNKTQKEYSSIWGSNEIWGKGNYSSGTLGLIGKSITKDEYYILSAKHVLYGDGNYSNNKNEILMKFGNSIVTIADNFLSNNELKKLEHLDFAISKIREKYIKYIKSGVEGSGFSPLNSKFGGAQNNMIVKKNGARTDIKEGRIRHIAYKISYRHESLPNQFIRIQNAILIDKISEDGDSGAMILDYHENRILGMLVGGNQSFSAGIKIEDINAALKEINLELIYNFKIKINNHEKSSTIPKC